MGFIAHSHATHGPKQVLWSVRAFVDSPTVALPPKGSTCEKRLHATKTFSHTFHVFPSCPRRFPARRTHTKKQHFRDYLPGKHVTLDSFSESLRHDDDEDERRWWRFRCRSYKTEHYHITAKVAFLLPSPNAEDPLVNRKWQSFPKIPTVPWAFALVYSCSSGWWRLVLTPLSQT